MGPRSLDRGNLTPAIGSVVGSGASMGPRSLDRGNIQAIGLINLDKTMLQWGRDR